MINALQYPVMCWLRICAADRARLAVAGGAVLLVTLALATGAANSRWGVGGANGPHLSDPQAQPAEPGKGPVMASSAGEQIATPEALSQALLDEAASLSVVVRRLSLHGGTAAGGAHAAYAKSGQLASLNVELHGPYVAVKAWLGLTLTQYSQTLVLQSLELRPVGDAEGGGQTPLEVQAHVVLRLRDAGS